MTEPYDLVDFVLQSSVRRFPVRVPSFGYFTRVVFPSCKVLKEITRGSLLVKLLSFDPYFMGDPRVFSSRSVFLYSSQYRHRVTIVDPSRRYSVQFYSYTTLLTE